MLERRMGAIVFALAAAAGALVAGGPGEAMAETPPLEAYGASPAIDYIELSPSGELIARIVVVDETRAIAVTRIKTGEHLFAAPIGQAKVRNLRWIGEGRVLIVSSETQAIPQLGVPRSELFFGMILDLETKALVHVLKRTPGVLATLYGGAAVRSTAQGDALFARGVNVVNGQIDLHRIDLDTGRGRSVVSMGRTPTTM